MVSASSSLGHATNTVDRNGLPKMQARSSKENEYMRLKNWTRFIAALGIAPVDVAKLEPPRYAWHASAPKRFMATLPKNYL